MKRSSRSGLRLSAIALSVAVVGCGGGGIDEGMPADTTKATVPLKPEMVDMSGRSFSDQAKIQAKAAGGDKAAPADKAATPAPVEEKK
jgi:hypothetical protein